MLLNIDWSDPTIIGGIIGIIGSILGAIIGALFTILFTWLFSRGRIKFYVLETEYEVSEGIIKGVESYRYVTEFGEHMIEGIKINFQCLITNSKKENYSFSDLELVVKNNKNHFKKIYRLKDTTTTHVKRGFIYSENAENYVLEEHSNAILKLHFIEVGKDFYSNYYNCKFYIRFIDYKGNEKYKRIYFKLNDPKIVKSI